MGCWLYGKFPVFVYLPTFQSSFLTRQLWAEWAALAESWGRRRAQSGIVGKGQGSAQAGAEPRGADDPFSGLTLFSP